MPLPCRDISAAALLTDGSLVGPIDWGALAQLSAVTDIIMESNQLTGTLGAALPPTLKTLHLGDNGISGTLPQAWDLPPMLRVSGGGFFHTTQWWLGHSFALHCPHASPRPAVLLSALTPLAGMNVQELRLGSNQLSGTLPAALRLPDRLQYLDLSNNTLSGTLSPELRFPDSLLYLDLNVNHFHGALPALRLPAQLQLLSLGYNTLDGLLPTGEHAAIASGTATSPGCGCHFARGSLCCHLLMHAPLDH